MKLKYVRWFNDIRADDVATVGGKNASLGEMISQLGKEGIVVPDGFATTSTAYWNTLEKSKLKPFIEEEVNDLHCGKKTLGEVGHNLRRAVASAPLPEELEEEIRSCYRNLAKKCKEEELAVAVRSSATAEDLPEASFAGQQETYLNIRGEVQLIQACKDCYASLFTDRAITYRKHHGFEDTQVALSIGIQQMVRSDRGSAGVMFTCDTETGFPDVVVINSSWGIGENVVQGTVSPDEYVVYKPTLEMKDTVPILKKTLGKKEKCMVLGRGVGRTTNNVNTPASRRRRFSLKDADVLLLSRWAKIIENHYSKAMDIEWAKDGMTGKIYIVQARPETVQTRVSGTELINYSLQDQVALPTPVVQGASIGQAILHGEVCVINNVENLKKFRSGCILVTEITDPDWVPIMRKAAGIITDHGGRTCHAAIVSRELGIPAIVGTGVGTEFLENGKKVTLCCDGSYIGKVYDGFLDYRREVVDLKNIPTTRTKVMLNLADPDSAFKWWKLPIDGIGLARMEFTVTEHVKAHPMALAHPERIKDPGEKEKIIELTKYYETPADYFIETLGRGLGTLAAVVNPKPVIIRMSDFKTNEYASLLGGRDFEPKEENPMIGFRGASRYYSPKYRDGFALECKAIRYIRETLGLRNVIVMIPFCRTLEEADKVLEVMAEEGLVRSKDFQVYVMCEIPSNVILAKEFGERFDGFSIGSNDLTQLTLGIDRDSEQLADLFDERDEAVLTMIRSLIKDAKSIGKKVGICGQAPSDHLGYAEMLAEEGIDSISLNPDSVLRVRHRLAKHENFPPHYKEEKVVGKGTEKEKQEEKLKGFGALKDAFGRIEKAWEHVGHAAQ